MEQKFSVLLLFTLFFTSIFFAVPFFSTSILAQSKETGVLYLWEISSGKVWKSFGDDETQQKYKGEIKEEKPEGLGVTLFPDGTKYMGQWHDGMQHGQGTFIFTSGEKVTGEWKENAEWNITKYDINEKIIAKYADGILLIDNKKEGVLFFRKEFGSMEWLEAGDEEQHYIYEGEIENDKPDIIHTIGLRSFQSIIAWRVSKKLNIPLVVSDQGGLTTHPFLTESGFFLKPLLFLNALDSYLLKI